MKQPQVTQVSKLSKLSKLRLNKGCHSIKLLYSIKYMIILESTVWYHYYSIHWYLFPDELLSRDRA